MLNRLRPRGLRVKLTLDDDGRVGGMIHYLPIEQSFVDGHDLYFIPCIWVHGHKKGRGNFQRKGMGKALLAAAEDDVKRLGAKGIAAWGLLLPFWMKASWFKKRGYVKADRNGMAVLLWKPFTDDATPPRWLKRKKKPESIPGRVSVTALVNGWCPVQNIVCERARRAVAELGDRVVFREIDTSEQETLLEWGVPDALFNDDKAVRTGPPPSYKKIRKLAAKRLRRI